MEKQKRLSEDLLEGIIPEEEPIMNFQPVVKLDKFGKKKIDRTIVLTTHHIYIVYEGVLDLELKSKLEIRQLHYVIKCNEKDNVLMLFFANKSKSCMHILLEGGDDEPNTFYDLLKLRWATLNPEQRLKIFVVP